MAENDEVTLDIDALDAAKAKKEADRGKPADSEPEVVVDAELAAKTDDKAVLTPEDGLDKLKKQLADEKTARIAAEARANEAAHGEAKARGDVQTSQLDLIKGAIEQTTQQGDVLEKQYADAMAAQDFTAVAKLQREIARNETRLSQLETGKTQLERAPKPVVREPAIDMDAFCKELSPKSAAWVRAHPECLRNKSAADDMFAAHRMVTRRGIKADTPEYFKAIEMELDIPSPGESSDTRPRANSRVAVDDADPTADAAQAATGGRSAAPAAAPVSRSGNGAGGRPGVVKLGPQQREMARNLFPESKDPDLEYAKNMTLEERKRGPV